MRHILFVALAAAACGGAHARPPSGASTDNLSDRASASQDTGAVFFGVYDPTSREYGADPLPGRFGPRGWQADSAVSESDLARTIQPFRPGAVLAGIDSTGRAVRVVIDSLPKPMGDMFVGLLAAHLDPPDRRKVGPVLFWTGTLHPTVLRSLSEQLTPALIVRVQQIADSLFALALRDRDSEDSLAVVRLRDLRVVTLPGADSLLIAHAAADMVRRGREAADDRGSVFVVLSRPALSVKYASFGHPEWSPNSTTVRDIGPVVYFTLPGDPRVLMFATYVGPWEDNGFGILDVATGKPLAWR